MFAPLAFAQLTLTLMRARSFCPPAIASDFVCPPHVLLLKLQMWGYPLLLFIVVRLLVLSMPAKKNKHEGYSSEATKATS